MELLRVDEDFIEMAGIAMDKRLTYSSEEGFIWVKGLI
jgi:hypothetical protein